MSFSSVRPITSDARSSGNSSPRQVGRQHEHPRGRGARGPIRDRVAERANRDRRLRVGDRGTGSDRSWPGRQRPVARRRPAPWAPRPAAAGKRRRRRRARPAAARRPRRATAAAAGYAAPPTAGPGAESAPRASRAASAPAPARASTPARSRSRAAPCRRGRPRWARRGRCPAAATRSRRAARPSPRPRRASGSRPTRPPSPIGAVTGGHARHRRPVGDSGATERGGGALAAQRDAVVADLDFVAFAQRRRGRDLRAVDANAGEAARGPRCRARRSGGPAGRAGATRCVRSAGSCCLRDAQS